MFGTAPSHRPSGWLTDLGAPDVYFLNVTTEDGLKDAVTRCFASIDARNGVAYRERLTGNDQSSTDAGQGPVMNVVIQKMIDPLSAGVYFTKDPTNPEAGWLIEWVDGLGDALVSGKRTPRRVRRENAGDSALAHVLLPVIERVERLLQFPVDVEWAIDRDGRPWILQARPITVQSSSRSGRSRAMARDIARLARRNAPTACWDGHAFAEGSGIPSELSFSIWARAFGSRGSLGAALRSAGYLGSGLRRRGSALERVLGMAPDEQGRLKAAVMEWRNRAMAAFLTGYRETMRDSQLWPADPKRHTEVIKMLKRTGTSRLRIGMCTVPAKTHFISISERIFWFDNQDRGRARRASS